MEFDKLSLTDEQKSAFEDYFRLLTEENEKVNLTAITEKNDVFDKHFFDSLLLSPQLKSKDTLCDVGCGGGFPSIPLAIIRKDVSIVAFDATRKKTDFCQKVKESLALSNLSVLWTRAEELAKTRREAFSVVTARAVASGSTLLEYCSPLVKVGGRIVLFKTPEESFVEQRTCDLLGLVPSTLEDFVFSYGKRRLLVYKKVRECPKKYPREGNLPRKQPL